MFLIICNISSTFELLSVPYMMNIYIYNISVICCPNITVQCRKYDYVVAYGRNTHNHTYKNEKQKINRKKDLVLASYTSRH
jgi:hypothetical protein